MRAWLERIWSWVKAGPSTMDDLEEKQQREHQEREEQARQQKERPKRRGDTDGYRFVG